MLHRGPQLVDLQYLRAFIDHTEKSIDEKSRFSLVNLREMIKMVQSDSSSG
jgi:hypothetical protein